MLFQPRHSRFRFFNASSNYDCFELQAYRGWALSSIKPFWSSKDTELFLHTSLLCNYYLSARA